jgi:hypothetical protein
MEKVAICAKETDIVKHKKLAITVLSLCRPMFTIRIGGNYEYEHKIGRINHSEKYA